VKPLQILFGMAGALPEIRTEYLPNSRVEHKHYTHQVYVLREIRKINIDYFVDSEGF
jgi:hypothetical protein